jgi:plasmid stability protein
MPSVLVRNLSEETHLALKRRAKAHGASTAAEIRLILEEAVREKSEEPKVGFGTRLNRIAVEHGGWDLDIKRNQEPVGSATFE